MHKLVVDNFGPITHCEVNVADFIVLTGPQASGKSTIAKLIYFFRTVKDDVYNLITNPSGDKRIVKELNNSMREKFLQLFGIWFSFPDDMKILYEYSDSSKITVTLQPGSPYKYIFFDNSIDLRNSIRTAYDAYHVRGNTDYNDMITVNDVCKKKLCQIYNDDCDTIFIPAGRNMITLLTEHLFRLFTNMNDIERRNIDFCTYKFIQLVSSLKQSFAYGISGYHDIKRRTTMKLKNEDMLLKVQKKIEEIIKGEYRYADSAERIYLNGGNQYVKLNYASSGQQETVWVCNIIFHYLLQDKKVFLIVEEPESHLYPDAQMHIMNLLLLFMHAGNQVLITTHSPYILGEINNMLLATDVVVEHPGVADKVDSVVPGMLRINPDCLSAYYTRDGEVRSAFDNESKLIINELIDGASDEINSINDKLIAILFGARKEETDSD